MNFSRENFHGVLCTFKALKQHHYNINKYLRKNFHGTPENHKNVKVWPNESFPVYSILIIIRWRFTVIL